MLHAAQGPKLLSVECCRVLPCCVWEGVQHLPAIVQATPQDSVSELLMVTRGQAAGMDTCSNVPAL